MENSPPEIQTIPGGALCGARVVLGLVSAKTAFAIAGLAIVGLAVSGLAPAAGVAADSTGAAVAIAALASALVPCLAE